MSHILLLKCSNLKLDLGMVAGASDPSTGEQRQKDVKFKANLG